MHKFNYNDDAHLYDANNTVQCLVRLIYEKLSHRIRSDEKTTFDLYFDMYHNGCNISYKYTGDLHGPHYELIGYYEIDDESIRSSMIIGYKVEQIDKCQFTNFELDGFVDKLAVAIINSYV